jgi:aspartate carbamoyltransferase catalytic subunit
MKPAALVVRHAAAGAPAFLARHIAVPVVNAGDGAHEHPSQALLDAFTLQQRLGLLAGRSVAIVGDIAHSRVARSDILCLTRLGAKVRLCGPPSLLPTGIETLGTPGAVSVFTELAPALEGVDAVMGLRLQRERLDSTGLPGMHDYHRRYGLTRERLETHAKGALVLHPGPINRGVEMTSEVADGPQSVILEQVENGVAVRMALLRWVLA